MTTSRLGLLLVDGCLRLHAAEVEIKLRAVAVEAGKGWRVLRHVPEVQRVLPSDAEVGLAGYRPWQWWHLVDPALLVQRKPGLEVSWLGQLLLVRLVVVLVIAIAFDGRGFVAALGVLLARSTRSLQGWCIFKQLNHLAV